MTTTPATATATARDRIIVLDLLQDADALNGTTRVMVHEHVDERTILALVYLAKWGGPGQAAHYARDLAETYECCPQRMFFAKEEDVRRVARDLWDQNNPEKAAARRARLARQAGRGRRAA